MSTSTRSRSSSLFSLTSTMTSCISAPTSPRTTGWDEKLDAAAPLVLRWKPQLFTTAFSSSRSTHLHFTAFPPQNIPKSTFERVGVEVAMSLMHEGGDPTVLSMFATAQSQVMPTCDISIPSNLPTELAFVLRSDEWDYYSITGTAPLPIGIGSMNTTFRHCVAFRKLRNGFDRYIFGPGGLSIHSICQLQDAGAQYVEDIPGDDESSLQQSLQVVVRGSNIEEDGGESRALTAEVGCQVSSAGGTWRDE
jgi:hypothetical protein